MNLKFKKTFRFSFLKKRKLSSVIKTKSLHFGTFGIQAVSFGFLTYKQINTVRIKISRKLKKIENVRYKIYIRIFFTFSVTYKPKLSRMGKGSGSIKD